MYSFFQDIRHGVRLLYKSPGFTAAAVLTLALAIGANTAVFSIVSAILLRLLPYPDVERLVVIKAMTPDGRELSVGPDDFRDWQAQGTTFERMAYTWHSEGMLRAGPQEPERIFGNEVSDGFFQMLGVQPMLGRWFLLADQDQTNGHNRVIILSYGMWARRFGGRSDILGQPVMLGQNSYSVVGVMPQWFRFNDDLTNPLAAPDRACEYWLPMQHSAAGRRIHQYSAYGRLRLLASVELAQAQLSVVSKRLELSYPETNTGWGVKVSAMNKAMREEFRPVMLIFCAAVATVLLIACANVANLLLARATGRTRELAIRSALGASRGRIVRLLLVESALLSLVAAALGVLLAKWALGLAIGMAPAGLELHSILYIDRAVLVFTLGLSLLTGVLTGLAPAFASARVTIGESLKQGGAGIGIGMGRHRALNAFVVSQVALTAVLLVASALLLKSFLRLMDVNLGFRADHLLLVNLSVPAAAYPQDRQVSDFYRDLSHRVRELPGVLSAAAAWATPLSGMYSGAGLAIQGRPHSRDWTEYSTAYQSVTPGYFATLGIPLLRGRDFNDRDGSGPEPVVIVNDVLAQRYFPGEEALGKRIRPDSDTGPWATIVGVVGDVRHSSPEREPRPETYFPDAVSPSRRMFLAVRTAMPPATLAGPVREQIQRLSPEAEIIDVRTMEQTVAGALAARRHLMSVIGVFALLALVLATVGLAGMIGYSVSRLTHEIGVRMALGAGHDEILRRVLLQGLRLTGLGLGLGLAAALGITQLLTSFLFGVKPTDPLVFAVVPLILTVIGLAAAYGPARRASKVDPMVALRYE